jgi:hypothetical protein
VGPTKARVIRRYKFALDVFDKAGLLISVEKSSVPEDASTCLSTQSAGVSASPHKIASLRAVVAMAL